MNTDIDIQNEGSILVVHPLSNRAKIFCEKKFPGDAQRWCNGYVVEDRYIEPIVSDLQSIGYSITVDGDSRW